MGPCYSLGLSPVVGVKYACAGMEIAIAIRSMPYEVSVASAVDVGAVVLGPCFERAKQRERQCIKGAWAQLWYGALRRSGWASYCFWCSFLRVVWRVVGG